MRSEQGTTRSGLAGSAVFSDCGTYRYELARGLSGGSLLNRATTCLFVMLNPSTASATEDDPTIRRCIGYAERWGHGRLVVANLFAFRSTDPKALAGDPEPVGPENDAAILRLAREASTVVCAWGAHGAYMGRGREVVRMLRGAGVEPLCLSQTKAGHPGHPLYLAGKLDPVAMVGGAP